MNVTYDKKEAAVYIELAKGRYTKTKKISDVILVDEDAQGKILGIEILQAKTTIPAFNPKKPSVLITTS